MPQMPLNIDMQGRNVLVVGGGPVACRKVKALLSAGASVRLVAPALTRELALMAAEGRISVRSGYYESADLEGIFLAVAATNDSETNRRVAMDARQRGLLIDVTDAPDLGNCTFPAVLRRGSLEISVATGGRCPAFAMLVRDLLAGVIGDDYGAALERLAAQREKLLTEGKGGTYNDKIIRSLAASLIAELSEHKESP